MQQEAGQRAASKEREIAVEIRGVTPLALRVNSGPLLPVPRRL